MTSEAEAAWPTWRAYSRLAWPVFCSSVEKSLRNSSKTAQRAQKKKKKSGRGIATKEHKGHKEVKQCEPDFLFLQILLCALCALLWLSLPLFFFSFLLLVVVSSVVIFCFFFVPFVPFCGQILLLSISFFVTIEFFRGNLAI